MKINFEKVASYIKTFNKNPGIYKNNCRHVGTAQQGGF